MTYQMRELKARKAKFGFDLGSLHLGNVVELGTFFQKLRHAWEGNYTEELTGYTSPEIRIYTDNDNVAYWIRNYKP